VQASAEQDVAAQLYAAADGWAKRDGVEFGLL